MKKPSLKVSNISTWNKNRKKKAKEKEELLRSTEGQGIKLFTLVITLVAMALGMSYLSLFPQPLPILLAALVAFATYKQPKFGMPIGGVILGLGLLYHLSELYFLSFLGDIQVRVAFLVVWMTLFICLPIVFNRYKSALAIDFGILAVVSLFYAPIYFLAIPLIIASAVYFKKYVGLTIIYYVLLSVPLQLAQYYNYIFDIARDDWWVEAGSAPPLFVPLTDIAKDLTVSLGQFRLYDMSKFIFDITGQLTWVPDWNGRTLTDAFAQYLDSVPGIFMFIVIVAGLAVTLVFFTRLLVSEGILGSRDRFFLCFTAVIAAAIIFILLSALQKPLAFRADVGVTTMALGIFSTFLLTLPVLFIEPAPKPQATNQEIIDKTQSLLDKIVALEASIGLAKDSVPVVVTSPQGKALVLKDTSSDILKAATLKLLDQADINEKFNQLGVLEKDREAIENELNGILAEYQIYSIGEFANWTGKLRAAGLKIRTSVNVDFQKEMPLDQRIEAIKQIMDGGKALVKEVSDSMDPIYGIIRPLYDQTLPPKCYAVEYANSKLDQKQAPWIALEALYGALNGWKRQYGSQIQQTMKYLQTSLVPIAELSRQSMVLPAVFGEDAEKVLGYAKRAEGIKQLAQMRAEKYNLDVLDIVSLRDDVVGFIEMANDVLLMLYREVVAEEEAIEGLLPTKDFMWQKNESLRSRLEAATEQMSKPEAQSINLVMERLPRYLGYIDEAVQTLASYAERREFLMNYPLAATAIEEQLKLKPKLLPSDLPFRPHFAAEYLRLYYTTRFGEYMFDKEELALQKRP
ncbi:MAG: hypothetical protein NWE93_11470 [Candidatus Bathyarchaeota archaeon]|nr:hypothetical protein [Candidatus Bathyarchaeota archaeon]